MKPDRIISGLISATTDLKHLLNGGQIDSVEPGLEAPAFLPCTPERQIKSSKPLQDIIAKSSNTSVKSRAVSENDTKINCVQETKTPLGRKGQNQGKIKKGGINNSKVGKKEKPVAKQSRTKSNTNGRKSPTTGALNKSNVKQDKGLETIPVTPDSKRSAKILDLSALGMSPSTPAINKRNTKGETPLHVACIKGDREKVLQQLEEGANPNSKDHAGWTPLHEACSHGFLGIAELLLQHGAIVDVPGENNENPLHDAVTHGQVEVIKLLRSWGASDTARNLYGHTPRSLASKCEGAEEINGALDTPVDTSLKRPQVMPPLLDKIVLLGSGLSTEQTKKLDSLAKVLRARVVSEFSPEVSHIITECTKDKVACQRTLKYMMGVVSGKWIISPSWVDECLSGELAVNPESHELCGSSLNTARGAPTQGRTNSNNMRPGLFNGCHMFILGNLSEPYPNKRDIEALIKAGGGTVLAREPNPESISEKERTVPFHSSPEGVLACCSHFIIYQEGISEPQLKYDMAHIKSLPLNWLLSCVDHYQLVPPFK
ncbi:BRCA1-associated RING domain protein 1-like isoform X2 [Panulirus ornatus]